MHRAGDSAHRRAALRRRQRHPPIASALSDSQRDSDSVDAWSRWDVVPGAVSGHDRFFNTFGRCGLPTSGHTAEMPAEVASRAAAEHGQYLELIVGWSTGGAAALGRQVGSHDHPGRRRQKLLAAGMDAVVGAARAQIDAAEATMRAWLGCDTPRTDPGCGLAVRYLYQTHRVIRPEQTFAHFVTGWELVHQDPRVAGLSLVAPEDSYAALTSHERQMHMLGYLHASTRPCR